jgi:hypothetical protein
MERSETITTKNNFFMTELIRLDKKGSIDQSSQLGLVLYCTSKHNSLK